VCANAQSWYQHKKRCGDKKELNPKVKEEVMNNIDKNIEYVDTIKHEKEPENKSSVITNNENLDADDDDEKVLAYGSEDFTHITKDLIMEWFHKGEEGIFEAVKCMHYHPDKPQNRNIRVCNQQEYDEEGLLEVYVETGWEKVPKDVMISIMWKRAFAFILKNVGILKPKKPNVNTNACEKQEAVADSNNNKIPSAKAN